LQERRPAVCKYRSTTASFTSTSSLAQCSACITRGKRYALVISVYLILVPSSSYFNLLFTPLPRRDANDIGNRAAGSIQSSSAITDDPSLLVCRTVQRGANRALPSVRDVDGGDLLPASTAAPPPEDVDSSGSEGAEGETDITASPEVILCGVRNAVNIGSALRLCACLNYTRLTHMYVLLFVRPS
jgi:hypothetical protein